MRALVEWCRRVFAPMNWVGNALAGCGQMLSALAAITALWFIWYQVSAVRLELAKRYLHENSPQLAFSEAPLGRVIELFGRPVLHITIPLMNQGSGVATRLDVQYVEALQVDSRDEHGVPDSIPNEDLLKQRILSDYDHAKDAFQSQLKYVVGRVVTRRNASIAVGRTYDLVYERPLRLSREKVRGMSADLFCLALYETEAGAKRMTSIWYGVDVDTKGNTSITPIHIAFVEQERDAGQAGASRNVSVKPQ